jgi:hypothetical protein
MRWLALFLMKHFREYDFGNGVTIKPRMELAGIVRTMGDTEPCEAKVFDVFYRGKLRATAETWGQAKGMALSVLANNELKNGANRSL